MKPTILYLIATFLFAIMFTAALNARDIEAAAYDTGRVNLLRSYWYEAYAVRDVLQWCAANRVTVAPVIVDKAALIVYGRQYQPPLAGDSRYALTAYPRRLWGYRLNRVYPAKATFMAVYEVSL